MFAIKAELLFNFHVVKLDVFKVFYLNFKILIQSLFWTSSSR